MSTNDGAPGTSHPLSIIALGRSSFVFALGGLAYKGVALVAVPVLARLLSPAEVGLLDLAAVLASIVGLTAMVGSEQGVAYLEPRTDRADRLWGSALAAIGIVAGILAAAALLFRAPLAELLTGSADNGFLIVAAALYGAVLSVTATALNAVRLHGTPRAYAISSFVIVTAEMAAAIAVALLVAAPVVWIVLAWAGAALLVAIPVLARFVPVPSRPHVPTMRLLVTFGGPLVPAAIVWLVGDAWIRSALARDADLIALGEYGIASRIGSVVGLAVSGFSLAWHPYIYRSPSGEVAARASNAFANVILGLAIVGVVLTGLAPEAIAIMAGERYAGARDAVPGLVGGTVALGGFVFLSAVASASGSSRSIAGAAILGVAVQIVAAPVLVGTWALSGAAYASLVGYIVAAAALSVGQRSLLSGRPGAATLLALVTATAGLAGAAAVIGWPLEVRLTLIAGIVLLAGAVAIASRAIRSRG